MAMTAESMLEKVGESWVVRMPGPNGHTQEFTCASESMARRLAASMMRRAPMPAVKGAASVPGKPAAR